MRTPKWLKQRKARRRAVVHFITQREELIQPDHIIRSLDKLPPEQLSILAGSDEIIKLRYQQIIGSRLGVVGTCPA